jgi:hypothetical protein
MDDALSELLREAMECGLSQEQLRTAVADAENEITAARQALSDADQAETSNRESIAVREKRLATLLQETSKRRNDFIKKYYRCNFKLGLSDEATAWVGENAQAEILRASVTYGLNLIEGLHRAKRAATLRVLEKQRDWCHAAGIAEAHLAWQLFLPVLKNDPGATLNLASSKSSDYATKTLELEKQIAEHKSKEVPYGTN